MDGRNSEKAYSGPTAPKLITITTGVFQSFQAFHKRLKLNASKCPAESWSSACSRAMVNARSSAVKNVAVSGKSGTSQNEAKPARTVTRPSRMNIHAQPGKLPTPSIFEIAAARRPPKAPETVAAEKKIAARKPNSRFLYQQER
ncbi:hypothetical protein Mapa_006122 [Marchantia paleacea]|nr:hypothetical protein Mapa_006122 [Marchantia paleacea]